MIDWAEVINSGGIFRDKMIFALTGKGKQKMPDREKAIKGLQIERECVSRDCDRDCGKCDLVQERDWLLSVYDDAIALLKEQGGCENCAIAIEDRQPVVRCRDCINCVKEPNGELYCDILAVGYEPLGSKRVSADWFCADGERKSADEILMEEMDADPLG